MGLAATVACEVPALEASNMKQVIVVIADFAPAPMVCPRHAVPLLTLEWLQILTHFIDQDRHILVLATRKRSKWMLISIEGELNHAMLLVQFSIDFKNIFINPRMIDPWIASTCSAAGSQQLFLVQFQVQLILQRLLLCMVLTQPVQLYSFPPDHDFTQFVRTIGLDLRRKVSCCFLLVFLFLFSIALRFLCFGFFHELHVLLVLDHSVTITVCQLEEIDDIFCCQIWDLQPL
mmetsp:Transcript_41451/g.64710  ORF Transcript_41451/g.64710 Transcript_41451/m.64710 type:complete len:233 (-) Transcript_41451:1565-2263(-)